MSLFIFRRVAIMLFTSLCLTFVVFFLTNLYPNLEKMAKTQGNFRMNDAAVLSFLDNRGYLLPLPVKYGEWLGVYPGYVKKGSDGEIRGRCFKTGESPDNAPKYCGIIQGYWGYSTRFKADVWGIVTTRLGLTGVLMFWGMAIMVPSALLVGILAGMREGSRTDRSLSTFAIATTATPEYVSGVILISVFASSAFGLKWFKGTATSAMENPCLLYTSPSPRDS